MANIIIKTEARRADTKKILCDFRHGEESASKEKSEYAEYIAVKTRELQKERRGG